MTQVCVPASLTVFAGLAPAGQICNAGLCPDRKYWNKNREDADKAVSPCATARRPWRRPQTLGQEKKSALRGRQEKPLCYSIVKKVTKNFIFDPSGAKKVLNRLSSMCSFDRRNNQTRPIGFEKVAAQFWTSLSSGFQVVLT